MDRRLTLFGFYWDSGALVVRKTGVRVRVDFPLLVEIFQWALYLPLLAAVALVARHRRPTPFKLWYTPELAGPWYLLRGAALWAGYGAATTPQMADAAFYFDDATQGVSPSACGLHVFNGACTDISKSHVAAVFEEVFGYPLRVNPLTTNGPIVEKAEKNGVHDGGVVDAPLAPKIGYAYQRLIDTTGPDGMAHDLRTPCVGGRPVLVWEKTKPADQRFTINNRRAVLRDPASVYSPTELEQIAAFTTRMGLDWGGIDILRDGDDGRLYIVDVNKTDLGPVIALSWSDKLRSMERLSRALSSLVEPAPQRSGPRGATAATVEPGPPATPVPKSSSVWTAFVLPLLPVAALFGLGLFWAGLHPQQSALDALARNAIWLRATAASHPLVSVSVFVLVYAFSVSSMLPIGLVLIFAGGYIFGPLAGSFASIAGATFGAVISYAMARLAPQHAVQRWERRLPRLRQLREAFVMHPLRYTLLMRLMPLTPFTLVSLAAGLNRIDVLAFAIGTGLGVGPECLLYSSIGAALPDGASLAFGVARHPEIFIGLLGAALLVFGSLHAPRRSSAHQGEAT